MKLRETLIERSKTKNGVYSYNGTLYRTKNGALTHYANGGQILQVFGHFDVAVGRYDWSHEARALLKSIN
jgi:hypothetical protein